MQFIISHDSALWQHANTWQQILAWGKSPWSRKSWNLNTRCSSSGVHQTHEVCQRLPSSYALGFLMHRAHRALWMLIRSESQTWRVHTNTSTLRWLQQEMLLITLFLNCTRDKITEKEVEEEKLQNTTFTWMHSYTRPLQKVRYSTDIAFVHASCALICLVHLSYFIFHNHRGESVCHVNPGTHQGDGASF